MNSLDSLETAYNSISYPLIFFPSLNLTSISLDSKSRIGSLMNSNLQNIFFGSLVGSVLFDAFSSGLLLVESNYKSRYFPS